MSTPDVPTLSSPRQKKAHDLCCVGTALVDYLAKTELDVVASLGLQPGAMSLIDGGTAAMIRAAIGEGQLVSGGTVANTAAGVASLGGSPVFVGAVSSDDLGEKFEADLAATGVRAVLELLPPLDDGRTGTGACYVMVTPDSQRTMATSLGVSGQLHALALDESTVGAAELVYFDGYVLDFPDSIEIVERIFDLARASGTKVALGLADPFVVERHFDRLAALVERVDVLFSNEDEAKAMTGAPTVDGALAALRRPGLVAIVTCGPNGAQLASDDGIVSVAAVSGVDVVDVTAAGDMFAAGVCFGLTHDLGIEGSGKLGALCAAEAISHMGARPARSLAGLASDAGLI